MAGRGEPPPSGQRRPLDELLAGRASKRKTDGVPNIQRLQESAVYLLSSHQDLSDLLSEMENPPRNKLFCPSTQSNIRSPKGPAAFSGSILASVLQGQASQLGLPVGILSARTAASHIEQICRAAVDCSPSALLNSEQREKLLSLLQMVKDLSAQNTFCRSVFCQELWKVQTPLVLEAVWHLHKETVELEELLESSLDPGAAVKWLCSELSLLCQHMADSSQDTELPVLVLTDVVITLVQHGFQRSPDLGKRPERHKTSQVSLAVLDNMLSWVLDAITAGKQGESERLRVAECWLRAFEVSAYGSSVPLASREQFFIHTLTQILTYKPLLKVSDAVRIQGEWSFAKAGPLLTSLYRRLFVVLEAKNLIGHLQQVLETHEVNWQHVLTCVSTLVICQSEAQSLIKDLLTRLLTKAFESYELESIITAFLIARQAALEGPAAFPSYTEWFKGSFGNTTGYHSGSKKSLVFLLKFLSDLVPFEAPQYLKVHIIYPPFVPTKYRAILLEYISLAKTRLADLKVSIEDMGLYEDLSSMNDSTQKQPEFQALQDVEKAIHIFENTGKIPASVMEASIFRRPYYNSRFLPALLTPRVLPGVPDLRMRFIDSLKRSDKIPVSVYSGYLQACHREKQRRMQGEPMDIERSEEPMVQLKASLEELRPLITDPSRYAAVPAQIAVISERLRVVMGSSDSETTPLGLPIQLDFSAPKMDQQEHMVADLLLTSFCKNIMVASFSNPPGSQGPWPSLFVKMLYGHRRVLTSLLTRLLQLVCHQGSLLNDAHTLGLAAFAVHLNESKSLLPNLDTGVPDSQVVAEDADTMAKFWNHLLECRTGASLSFCLRFCTAAVSYTLCTFSSVSQDVLCSYIPPVMVKKIRHALPRECLEARGMACEEESQDAEASWRSLSDPSVNWKRAALCLWKQRLFSELLQLETFQFSFRDWLLSEMQVESCKDVLSETERQDYHHWALYQCYLPSSSAAGGCDGDLEQACTIIVDTMVDFCNRSRLSPGSLLDGTVSPLHSRTGSADILCRLQEIICDLEITSKIASASQVCRRPRDHQGHFIFKLFQERLKAAGEGSSPGDRLTRHQELLMLSRVLIALPPSLLINVHQERKHAVLDCGDFFHFVGSELKNICSRGCALPYDITEHFFRGLLSASLGCEEPSQGVDSILKACRDKCPILLTSAALWWPRLEPVLCCQWKRHCRTPLAHELQRLKEWQDSATSSFLTGHVFQPSDPAWISAAFLYFTLQRGAAQGRFGEGLRRLGRDADTLLVPMLFFSVMDLIPSRLSPKDGAVFRKCLDTCLEILGCLEESGVSWLLLFHPAEKEQGSHHILLKTASDHHLRMLPIAFYSLVPYLQQGLLTQEEDFLDTAVQMYAGLVQLFLDGEEPTVEQNDTLELITRSRQYLLRSIPQCPKKSQLHVNQLLDTCGDFDPEVKTALLNTSQSSPDHTLYDEPILF